jgi:hypothetical protein
MKKEKRIPTIVGLLFLVLFLAVSVYLTQIRTVWSPKASGDCSPINPQVTNITHTSVDISFTTSDICSTSLRVNNQNLASIKDPSRTHYFQAKNLKVTTSYVYSIISGGQNFTHSNYGFRTASRPTSSLPTSNLAWGKVYKADTKPASGSIVYLNIPGAAPLSSFVTADGNWSISLANSFNESKTDWFVPPTAAVEEDIVVISEDGVTTQVVNTTANNNPVPDIIIGQNNLSLAATTPIPTSAAGQIASVSPVLAVKTLSILNPKEGEVVSSSKPDFFGIAPANTKIFVELSPSSSASNETMSDSSGSWKWSYGSDLTDGSYSITVKTGSLQQPLETVSQKFSILISNSGTLSYESSPSATSFPTAIPTPSPTNIPTQVPTIRVAYPSTTSSPPVTGGTLPTILVITSALIFFFVSVKFIK